MPRRPPTPCSFTESYLQRFRNDPLIVPAVAPHALYTNSDETLKAARALANKYNAPLVIHLSETKKENDDKLAKRHMTPTKVLDSLGVLTGRTVAAHCVWVNDADMAILKARNVGVAHCPSSNMKLASGVAPVVKMLARASSGPRARWSRRQQQRFQHVRRNGPGRETAEGDHARSASALPAATAFEMATIRGARALGMEKEIGSLETGKRADLIIGRSTGPTPFRSTTPFRRWSTR